MARCLFNDCDATGGQADSCTPIVLHHGLFGINLEIGPIKLKYFRGIDKALADLGYPLMAARVHPTASIETRARQLKEKILTRFGQRGPKVVIIGHSMGGLDARYMISKLDMASRVSALATVTCPHRGSPYADWCLKTINLRRRAIQLLTLAGMDVSGFTDLTTERCAEFNERVIDSPEVKYFSVSAARPIQYMPPWGIHSYKIIQAVDGDNDGLVSVKSSTWGEHLGTWPADHWHTINHRAFPERRENATGDIAPFYVGLVQTLRGRGYIAGTPVAVRD